MARNEEKAQSMLSRFRAAKAEEEGRVQEQRPFDSSQCTSVKEAEKWRFQVIRIIAKKVAQIQNAGLGEFRIRDLNDEINRLLREKRHWEYRIKELGGGDYSKVGPKMFGADGREVPGNKGYKYFGAAKDLPGVRELFEQDVVSEKRKTRTELAQHIDADYFGYRDDDDGLLIPLEEEAQQQSRVLAQKDWEAHGKHKQTQEAVSFQVGKTGAKRKAESQTPDDSAPAASSSTAAAGKKAADVFIPDQKEIERLLLERQKKILMEKYASESLQATQQESLRLSGKA